MKTLDTTDVLNYPREHSCKAIEQALDESRVGEQDINRATIDTVRFMMKVTTYLARREHELWNTAFKLGQKQAKDNINKLKQHDDTPAK